MFFRAVLYKNLFVSLKNHLLVTQSFWTGALQSTFKLTRSEMIIWLFVVPNKHGTGLTS